MQLLDSAGLNTESTVAADKNLVSATLNALANKLWYEAYTTNERNLTGKAEIAEGLTTSSASKRMEDITFNETTGQGSYVYTPEAEGQTTTQFTKRILGTTADQEYIDAHVRQADGTYRFTKDSTIMYDTVTDVGAGAIAPEADLHIDASGHALTVHTNIMPPATEEVAAIKNDGKNINIKADKTSLFVNMNAHILSHRAKGIFNQSGTINISGMTEIGVTTASSVRAVEAEAGTVTLEGLQAFLSMDGEATAILAGTTGRININAKDGIAGDSSVERAEGDAPSKPRAPGTGFGLQRVQPCSHLAVARAPAVEGTVAALRRTEGHVEVEGRARSAGKNRLNPARAGAPIFHPPPPA